MLSLFPRILKKRFLVVLLLLGGMGNSSYALQSDAAPLERFEYRQLHLGVQVRIILYAPDKQVAKRSARAAFERIATLEDIFSDYRKHSELMRLSAQAGGPPVQISPDLFRVLRSSQRLARRTHGAFDVTVGPYVRLWRQVRESRQLPSTSQLRRADTLVGWEKMKLDVQRRTVRLCVPGMRLDAGGIAKGYILDRALAALQEHGVERALLRAGGDIVVSGAPPGREGWHVEVANAGSEQRYVTIEHAAIASSGDTQQFVEIDGARYSHVVDPRTGWALRSRTAATVIAPNGMTADSYATALTVMGPEEGRKLVEGRPGVSAYVRRVTEKGVEKQARY